MEGLKRRAALEKRGVSKAACAPGDAKSRKNRRAAKISHKDFSFL